MICRLHVSLLVEEFHLILMAMSSFLFGLVICINVSIPILDFFLWFPTVPKRYHLMSTAFEGLVPSRNNNTTRFTTISLLRIQQQPNLERCAYKIPFWSFLWTWHCPYHPCFLQQLQDDYNLSQYQCLAGATAFRNDNPNLLLGNPKNRWHWSVGPKVGLLHEVTPRKSWGKIRYRIFTDIDRYTYVYIFTYPRLWMWLCEWDTYANSTERRQMPTIIIIIIIMIIIIMIIIIMIIIIIIIWILIVPLSHMSHPFSQAVRLWFSPCLFLAHVCCKPYGS